MITKGYFVTGNDTNVGKTVVAAAICEFLISRGNRVCAIKPVASGCIVKSNKLYSTDALTLMQHSSSKMLPYLAINPFAFKEPIAPHLAAKNNNVKLSVPRIITQSSAALMSDADYIIIEGAGGWYTPISDKETMADLALAYGYPIVLVIGIRLGCINQALLTYKCINDSGVKIAGWVANVIDRKMLYFRENIETIKHSLGVPLLGTIPYLDKINVKKAARFLCF